MAREQKPNRSKMPPPPNAGVLADNPEAAEQPFANLDGSLELPAASEDEPVEVVKPKPKSMRKIAVVANRAGIHDNHRKVAGDKFEMPEHELGTQSWIDPVDKNEQVKHAKRRELKRQKINAEAQGKVFNEDDLAADE